MTTTNENAGVKQRRVRPIFAALLTLLFGWGMGFFYAGRTKAAIGWTIANLVFVLAVIAVAFAFPNPLYAALATAMAENSPARFLIELVIGLPVAVLAWVAAARRPLVARHGVFRLLGYLLILLAPIPIAFAMRFTIIQPFRIPSGAMQPTIQVGDYVFVQKWSYGYSRYSIAPLQDLAPSGRLFVHLPERGDIAVFRPEPELDRDFIKRIIGIPGDRVEMRDGGVVLNGQPVPRQAIGSVSVRDGTSEESFPAFRETLPNGVSYVTLDRGESELDNTREVVVPPGHYFVMGDDRDNSADSRVPSVVGMVPLDNLVGKVGTIVGGPNSR